MAFEIECGSCGHRLNVEHDAPFAICPVCETSLQVPATVEEFGAENGGVEGNVPQPEISADPNSATNETDHEPPTIQQPTPPELSDEPTLLDSEFPGLPSNLDETLQEPPAIFDEPETDADGSESLAPTEQLTGEFPSTESKTDPTGQFVFPIDKSGGGDSHVNELPQLSDHPANAPVSDDPVEADGVSVGEPGRLETAFDRPVETVAPAGLSAAPALQRAPTGGVPRFLFVMVLGYASAVTIALIWLWFRQRAHQLESLPDVIRQDVPPRTGYLVPEDAPMPWGHTLRLGQTRRFGNLEITPMRVSKGPARRVFQGIDEIDPTDPVLKIWIRIRNVSSDQTIQPFGRPLLSMRGPAKSDGHFRANIFVCRTQEKHAKGDRVFAYELANEESLDGQHVDRKLAPGRIYTTYIASSEDGLDTLTGDLVWRIHFRKGHNAETGRGVTTLIEVNFHSGEIEDETID